jgi:hypothetical protein
MKISNQISPDSFLISFIFHALILVMLGFITIKQTTNIREMVIDWMTDTIPQVTQDSFAPVGKEASAPNRLLKESTTPQTNPNASVTENVSQNLKVARSIEPPLSRQNSRQNSAPISGTGSAYLSGIKSSINAGHSGSNGYQLEDDNGAISVLKSVLPNPKISDYGKVTLSFKILSDGNVDPESIMPVVIDNPIYTNESIKALKQWQFSIINHISNKVYRISFIFKPE